MRTGPARLLLIAALPVLAWLSGCSRREPPNVVLVLADTLRADRMSLYGYERATTPHLEELAKSAVVFEGARSQASCTFPSVNSILTSRSPARFFDQPYGDWSIPDELPTLASILKTSGYATFAVSASQVVRATPSKVNTVGGYDAGFDVFDESCTDRPGACINDRTARLIEESRQPYFAYLHYMDPHHPYRAPVPYRHHFAKPLPAADRRLGAGDPGRILEWMYKRQQPRDWSREVAYLSDSYDDEIRYLDAQLARLLETVRASGDGRDTIVVLASDHGEDFLEHGDLMHCRTLYDTSIHVPLVLWLPGVAGRRIAGPVQNLGITPTILEYAGIDASPHGLEGTGLRRVIEGGDAGEEPVYAVQSSLRAVLLGERKLIYDLDSESARLFDLAADPTEHRDLAVENASAAHDLQQRLLERVAATEGDAGRARQSSRRVQERLRQLGYLE